MEKFLKNHKLTKNVHNAEMVYCVEVFDQCMREVEYLQVYCMVDVLRIHKYYLSNTKNFWWTLKVTLI